MKLKVFSVNDTEKNAIEYKVYHRKATNRDREFEYIGLYRERSVIYIGKVENIIYANLDKDNLIVIDSMYPPTEEQLKNIKSSIRNRTDADITTGHKFFCVNKFIETDFKKVSERGLRGQKIFNLHDYLEKKDLNELVTIANILSCKTWE